MSFDNQMAGDAIASKARRMLSLAGRDLVKRSRAGDLLRLASEVSGSDYYTQDLVIDDGEIDAKARELAAREVYALAVRRVNEGTMKTLEAPRPGWVRGGDDFGIPINPATIRSAIALYDIALRLRHEDEWIYDKAFLLERLHDFEGAAHLFSTVGGEFALHGLEQSKRCRAKAAGNFSSTNEAEIAISNLDARSDALTGSVGVVKAVRTQLSAALRRVRGSSGSIRDSASTLVERAEVAAQTAQRFAELLVDGDYVAARSLLGRNLRHLHAGELRVAFESMMGPEIDRLRRIGEAGDVCVLETSTEMPDLLPYDVAWVYVSVENAGANEAITVIVTQESVGARIRSIEWGRP